MNKSLNHNISMFEGLMASYLLCWVAHSPVVRGEIYDHEQFRGQKVAEGVLMGLESKL